MRLWSSQKIQTKSKSKFTKKSNPNQNQNSQKKIQSKSKSKFTKKSKPNQNQKSKSKFKIQNSTSKIKINLGGETVVVTSLPPRKPTLRSFVLLAWQHSLGWQWQYWCSGRYWYPPIKWWSVFGSLFSPYAWANNCPKARHLPPWHFCFGWYILLPQVPESFPEVTDPNFDLAHYQW